MVMGNQNANRNACKTCIYMLLRNTVMGIIAVEPSGDPNYIKRCLIAMQELQKKRQTNYTDFVMHASASSTFKENNTKQTSTAAFQLLCKRLP